MGSSILSISLLAVSGLVLFLYAVSRLALALREVADDRVKNVLDRLRARVETVLLYNLDAWDGYPAEREKIFAAVGSKKLISLVGDTHNAWYNDLTTASGRKIGAEFACSSVSSPGFESLFGGNTAALQGFTQSTQLLIDDLLYLDASERGYVLAEFGATNATSQWRYVASLSTPTTATTTNKTVTES